MTWEYFVPGRGGYDWIVAEGEGAASKSIFACRTQDENKVDAHVTILKMAEKLGVSKITINRAVKGLNEKDLIQREGSAKTGKGIILK